MKNKIALLAMVMSLGVMSASASTLGKESPVHENTMPRDTAQFCNIEVKAPSLKNHTLYLGQYYMGKLYTRDSLSLNKRGKGNLMSEKPLPEGVYVLYLPSGKYVDMLVGNDQEFSVELDTLNLPQGVRFSGAAETEDFYAYSMLLFDHQQKMKELRAEYDSAQGAEKEAVQAKIELLGVDVQTRQDELIAKDPQGMLSLFLRGLKLEELPEWEFTDSTLNVDSLRSVYRYQFYKNHYLSNIDWSDPRSMRTPYVVNSIDTYFNQVLLQINDSIIPQALQLVEQSKGNKECFQSILGHLLNYSVRSNIMGMDNLMVELANRYYFTGDAFWADSTLLANLRTEVNKIQHCMVGHVAHDLVLADKDGVYQNAFERGGSQITVLFFYEPSCGHCRKTSPLIADFARKYANDPRIKVLGVYMLEDKEEWQKFVAENKMESMVNVWDPNRMSFYWYWYDTSSTPMIYVLDKDHKVFAKKIDVSTLERVAQYELK